MTRVHKLHDGTFLLSAVGGTRSPALFDAAGRFQRLIARRGNGPGEVEGSRPLVAQVAGDSIWILDGTRRLVFSPSLDFVRQEQLANRPGTDMLVSTNGTIVTAGEVGTPEAAGYPLQLRDGALGLRRAFGVADPTVDQRRLEATGDDRPLYLYRRLVPYDRESFWVFNDSRFLLERYALSGDLLGRYRHAVDGWYAAATRLQPSAGDFNGLALHGVQQSTTPGLIWLIYHAPRSGYSEPAPGTPFIWQAWTDARDLVVEAWDTARHEVIATGRIPQAEARVIRGGPDLLALVRPKGDEVYELQVVALRLVRP